MVSRPVKPRARRIALMVASVPELTKRTRSMAGINLDSEGGLRQAQPDFKAPGSIAGARAAAVGLHHLGGDGEANAFAAAVAVARLGHAVEGLKNALKIGGGYAGSIVAYGDRQ